MQCALKCVTNNTFMYPAGVAIWQRVAEISSLIERISNENVVLRLAKRTEHRLTLLQCHLNTHNALQKLSCENVTSQQACRRRRGVVGDCSRQHPNSELEYIRQPKQCNPSSTVVQQIRADQYRRQRLNEEHHSNLMFHVPSQFISISHGR